MRIDGLQYAKWSEKVFQQMREGGVDAVHVTIAYHENFRETVLNMEQWNTRFDRYSHLICRAHTGADIRTAQATGRTAIIFGSQNPSPMEDDIGLLEILHTLGLRIMQLTYNNQSLLATGCYEKEDAGITRMGRQVIQEMNRVGMVVDMSHSADRSTIEAAYISERPICISHANPHAWHPALRNKRDEVIKAVTDRGGMIGFSLYPHHLKDKSQCTLESFCQMIAEAANRYGVDHLGIGSDLCQDHPDEVVKWMREGRWTKDTDYGEGSAKLPGFPAMPSWFKDNRDFDQLELGLHSIGFNQQETKAILGDNWLRFFDEGFVPL